MDDEVINSPQQLITIINNLIIDNNTNQVTPYIMRAVLTAMVNSMNTSNATAVSALPPLTFNQFTNQFALSIIDNLTAGGSNAVLSAEQGKVLKGLIDNGFRREMLIVNDDVYDIELANRNIYLYFNDTSGENCQINFTAAIADTFADSDEVLGFNGIVSPYTLIINDLDDIIFPNSGVGFYEIPRNSEFSLRRIESGKWTLTIRRYVTDGGSGGSEKATQGEVDDGTNDTKFVTPLTLKNQDYLATKQYVSDAVKSNLMLFPTTANSDIATYKKLVTNTADADYDDTAVDVSTGALTTTDVLISSLASEAGLLSGNPGVFEVSITGNIRRTSGTANGTFYFEVYHRDLAGTETLICTSDVTLEVSSATYIEFTAKALWDNGDFISTDRIVYKFYGNKAGVGSNPTFDFQFGGSNPVRSTVPVAATLLLEPIYDILDTKADLYSPVLTGTPTSPTPTTSAGIANKAYVDARIIAKKATDSTPVTGGTTEQILESILIPANTVAVGDIIRVFWGFNKTVSTGTTNVWLKHNTSNSLTGANQLSTSGTLLSGTRALSFQRHLNVRTGVIEHIPVSNTAAFENIAQSGVRETTPFDVTIDNWFLITGRNITQSADSLVCSNYIFEKL